MGMCVHSTQCIRNTVGFGWLKLATAICFDPIPSTFIYIKYLYLCIMFVRMHHCQTQWTFPQNKKTINIGEIPMCTTVYVQYILCMWVCVAAFLRRTTTASDHIYSGKVILCIDVETIEGRQPPIVICMRDLCGVYNDGAYF